MNTDPTDIGAWEDCVRAMKIVIEEALPTRTREQWKRRTRAVGWAKELLK